MAVFVVSREPDERDIIGFTGVRDSAQTYGLTKPYRVGWWRVAALTLVELAKPVASQKGFGELQLPSIQSTTRTGSGRLALGEHDRHFADFHSLWLDRNRLPIAPRDQ